MEFLSVVQSSPFWLGVAVVILGLCVGSFLNVVIHRLPRMMEAQWRAECASLEGRELPAAEPYNLWTPRSRCPSCGGAITALQNVPVLSWLALRGKCAACKAPISARYPLVELAAAALAVLVAWRFGYSAALAMGLVYVWALLALTFIDFDTQLLPDDITLPLLWVGLIANTFGIYTNLRSAASRGCCGAARRSPRGSATFRCDRHRPHGRHRLGQDHRCGAFRGARRRGGGHRRDLAQPHRRGRSGAG